MNSHFIFKVRLDDRKERFKGSLSSYILLMFRSGGDLVTNIEIARIRFET